ncbi:hypothetical protein OJAV_G00222330 [Oryzias javanicus]|uniref:EF-hand domain-containing protein n=1 Tax=Oryzias javanicus TaxID=123683 RepID=A0A3S2NQ18_ORYJA|nr:hypothetical protein OJAV_G00222330 [Oryzias javanicus]
MSPAGRKGALEHRWSNNPPRSIGFVRPLRPPVRPRIPIVCPESVLHRSNKEPMYVTFISKAVLWDREVHHTSVRGGSLKRPSMCPRFLSHMRVPPAEDLHPLRFLNSMSMQELPSEEEMFPLTSTKTQSPEGHFQTKDVRGQTDPDDPFLPEGRRSSSGVRVQTPATPPPSRFHSTPPHKMTPPPDSGNSIPTPVSFHPPCSCSPRRTDEPLKEKEEVLPPAPVKPDSELSLGPAGLMCCVSPSSLSQGSFSLSSRPLSSSFSRSTDLSRGSRNTSDFMDSDAEDVVSFSSDQRVKQVSLTPNTPTGSNRRPYVHSPSAASTPLAESVLCRPEPPSPVQRQRIHSPAEGPDSSCRSAEKVHTETPAEASPGGCATPSSTGPCLSPQRSTPHFRPEWTFTPSESRLGSHRWPVLPPITPIRGHSSSSRCSGFSCSLSHIFDDLEAIAPASPSCLSLEQPSDSSRSPSPNTEMSPGLAALTVGCDSGDLGSLSRVQLLLLDRPIPDAHLSPSELEEGFSPLPDWSDPMVQYDDDTGDWRPLTAGGVSERSHSAARGDTSDWCESPSGSPSSWVLEPSLDTLRSSDSPLRSDNEEGNPAEEEPNYQGNGDRDLFSGGGQRSPEGRAGQRGRQMEERETKAWSMLSKLQENTPQRSSSSTSRSNFEDFDFLAKYCIFSQEKLAEYKRAFEAEDRSGDGYISSLQVLLALKTIIPEEHLSEEEEIYVYRILEMVDFKVTDGLVDLRLFAVIASLAQKIASMDEFMRSLISNMDFRSLEVRLFKAKLIGT